MGPGPGDADMQVDVRAAGLETASYATFDTAVIGGGINGASLYHRLRRAGYRAIVLDRGDFASGTSQASGMMVWGGLLYLRNFDLPAVIHFSKARDRMVHRQAESVSPLVLRFVPAAGGRLGKLPAMGALYFYWLLGRGRRRWPHVRSAYQEAGLLASPRAALCFEEAMLRQSDSRFVLDRLAPGDGGAHAAALNYAEVRGGVWSASDGLWRIEVRDTLTGRELEVRARAVANCAGVWTDGVNMRFGIRSPWRHAFSKGVYLVFQRAPEQDAGLVLEMGLEDDVVTSVPWGPVELWGPTETSLRDPEEGLRASPEDVSFLLDLRSRRLRGAGSKDAIVALRCGVRPLAVPAAHPAGGYPLDLSRRSRVVVDAERPWVSVYGGKLTGCAEVADRAMQGLRRHLPRSRAVPLLAREGRGGGGASRVGSGRLGEALDGAGDGAASAGPSGRGKGATHAPPRAEHGTPAFLPPGVEEGMPPPAWCRDHEFACTLEDYLRRRTNAAQWVPRGGLGRRDEHLGRLRAFAVELMGGDAARAEIELDRYRSRVAEDLDQILARV